MNEVEVEVEGGDQKCGSLDQGRQGEMTVNCVFDCFGEVLVHTAAVYRYGKNVSATEIRVSSARPAVRRNVRHRRRTP